MILLDTCALLWLAADSTKLSAEARAQIDAEPIVSVSAMSAVEIAIKAMAGKLGLPLPVREWWDRVCNHHNLNVALVDAATLIRSTELPPIHRDPVDRIIIALALNAEAPVVTADWHFARYGVKVIG